MNETEQNLYNSRPEFKAPKFKIIKYGDPILNQKSKKIEKVDDEIKFLAEDMLKWTKETGIGYGLAAVQIGKPIQLIVLHIENETIILINPEILEREGSDTVEEGCLSIPYAYTAVPRAYTIKVKSLDYDAQEVTREFSGLKAKAIQHEVDHLNGILMIDIVSPLKRKLLKKRIQTIKKRGQWDNW